MESKQSLSFLGKKNKTIPKSQQLNTVLAYLNDYYTYFIEEFKESSFNPEIKITKSKNAKIKDFVQQIKSKETLKKAKIFFDSNVTYPEEDLIKQKYEDNISEDSFYNISFFYINKNYLSEKVTQKIIKATPIKRKKKAYPKKKIYTQKLFNLTQIQKFFEILKNYNFEELESKELIYQSTYRDFILSSFMEFENIFNELYELVNKSREFTLINKTESLFNRYENCNYKQFKWEDLVNIATSPVSIEAYFELSKKQNLFSLNSHSELTESQINDKKEQIKKEVKRILNEYSIHEGQINTTNNGTYGISSVNKNIIINNKLRMNNSETDESLIRANASIVVTLLHEINHILVRTQNIEKDNYFLQTIDFKESGAYFEHLIFNDTNTVFTTQSSLFILDYFNWQKTLSQFRKDFTSVYVPSLNSNMFFSIGKTKVDNSAHLPRTFTCNKQCSQSMFNMWDFDE